MSNIGNNTAVIYLTDSTLVKVYRQLIFGIDQSVYKE